MSDSLIGNGLGFVVQTIFNLYTIVVMLRLFLQAFGLYGANPVMHLFSVLTQPVIAPFRKVLPTIRGLDMRLVALAFLLCVVQVTVLSLLAPKVSLDVLQITVLALVQCVKHAIDIFFFAIIGRVILSFLPHLAHHPIADILVILSEPLLKRARALLPPVAGFDLSPIPVLVFLKLLELVLVSIIL